MNLSKFFNTNRIFSKNYAPKIAAHSNQNRELIGQLQEKVLELERKMNRVEIKLFEEFDYKLS